MRKYVGSIFWNVGGQLTDTTGADWACWSNGVAVDDCAGRYMSEMSAKGRGIILMHDTHSKTIDMTKLIVEQLGASHFVGITSAPQIAAAVGVIPDNGGGATPPPPPPPPPSAGCGDVDYKGFCEKNNLTWCENGVLKTADCVSKSKVCSWKSDTEGHDCVAPAPCGDATYYGSCSGEMLTWCDESGALRTTSCAAKSRRCVLESEQSGFNCVP
jgi:hypothetical protein